MTRNYLFSINNSQAHNTKPPTPCLVSDYAPQGQAYDPNDPLPDLGMLARQFVIAHLKDEASGLPRLSVDATLAERSVMELGFAWLTKGMSQETIELGHLLASLERRGIKIPLGDAYGTFVESAEHSLGTL